MKAFINMNGNQMMRDGIGFSKGVKTDEITDEWKGN